MARHLDNANRRLNSPRLWADKCGNSKALPIGIHRLVTDLSYRSRSEKPTSTSHEVNGAMNMIAVLVDLSKSYRIITVRFSDKAILRLIANEGELHVWATDEDGNFVQGPLSKVLAEIKAWLGNRKAAALAEIETRLMASMHSIGKGVDVEVIEDGAVRIIATQIVAGSLVTVALTEPEFHLPNPDRQRRAPAAES